MPSKLEPHLNSIQQAYASGATLAQIATDHGTAVSNLRWFLERRGIAVRPPRRGSSPKLAQTVEAGIITRYKSGCPAQSIANVLNLPYSLVDSVLTRHNCYTRRKTRAPELVIPCATDLAYLAGIIDGEGTIRAFVAGGRNRVLVQVANTSEDLIHWLEQFGGKSYWDSCNPKRRRHKPCAAWRVTRALDCFRLLSALRPYLRIKRAAADKAVACLQEFA
jgi:hypothetical protein